MSGWYLGALPGLCAFTAIIELDAVHVGQWMLSRPMILGPMLGALGGVPWLGLAGGALVELFCVDVLPVGASLPINGAVAVASLVLLCAGPSAVPVSAAFPAALFLAWAYRAVERAVRTACVRIARRAMDEVELGRPARLGRRLLSGLGLHAAATAAYLYAAAWMAPLLGWGWDAVPAPARRGLEPAFMNAPWLGLGALLYSLRPRG
ncbi:MAG: PTS sugar transporter subunit IIC [Elusimicrobia bacterium]|nr:PTS sugar transporter subunit IIC [Elusimicrobiota bacterium]